MIYKVVKYFEDLTDNRFAYHEGDIFPRDGKTVSDERLQALASGKNRRKIPLIEPMPEQTEDTTETKPKRGRPKKK